MSAPKLIAVNDLNFDLELNADPRTFVLKLGATWCAPCRSMEPLLERLARDRSADVRVATLDIEESPEVAGRFGIRGVPTVLVFRAGRECARHLGSASLERLEALVS